MQVVRVLCIVALLAVAVTASGIEVRSASRTLSLTSSLAKETTEFVYHNSGSSSISTAEIAVLGENLAYLVVSRDGKELVATYARDHMHNGVTFKIYTVRLKTTVSANSSVSLKVHAVYGRAFSPKPDEITQSQRQLVVYHGSHFVASPYKVDSQTTKIKTPSSNVLSISQRKPVSRSGDTTELGPYKNVQAFGFSSLQMHFESSAAFLVVSEQLREVEISHWGNVAVEEHYTLHHTGSALKGAFSRLDYMHGVRGNSIEEFTQFLPGDAIDIYYRDVIGNISTSHVSRTDDNRVKFELKPRFVMFGGWKTVYYTGYNLPASRYLSVDDASSRYTLSINLINDLGEVLTEQLETRFILPEGATDIKIEADVPISEPEHSLRHTYLDTTGRPVLSVRASNLIKEHSTKTIRVSYTFPSTQFLHEPLLVISAYFSLFLVAIALLRLDLRISPATTA